MYPTLHDTERVFVNKTVDYFGDYKRGQIIVLDGEDRSTHYVKRLIGLPGDKIEMKNDQLYVNGKSGGALLSIKQKESSGRWHFADT